MSYNPEIHHRRSIRLRGWDYRWAGAYFVTLVTHKRALLFDDPILRRVAETMWQRIPQHFHHVQLDEWVVMPNHLHGIIIIVEASPPMTTRGSLGVIVGNFKSITGRRINQIRHTPGTPVWQRNYWERIVCNERELNAAREYIQNNPLNLIHDTENIAT